MKTKTLARSLPSDTLAHVERVLDEKVRPILRGHGGDIVVASLTDGGLQVKMRGSCANCPSAVYDVEQLVAVEVRDAVPEVRSVTLLTGVSDELLAMARTLLKGERP
jgi:Fe-S cluster biogenesis protein NfuA